MEESVCAAMKGVSAPSPRISDELGLDDLVVLYLGTTPSAPRRQWVRRHRRSASGQGVAHRGITRLEKLTFLVERETSIGELLAEPSGFRPSIMGPFSSAFHRQVLCLSAYELADWHTDCSASTIDTVEQEQVIGLDVPDPYTVTTLRLTERGESYFEVLRSFVPKEHLRSLAEFKHRFDTQPLARLLRYVSKRYPEMRPQTT